MSCSVSWAAPPLPQNGQFVGGEGSITRSGPNLNISQSSNRGIIDWTSFSIGAGRTVSISNGSGATLNRVTGNAMSQIAGTLSATGSAYLINPNGVLVGPGGVIATGGRFVASTLDTDNTRFMQGSDLIGLSGTSKAVVVNLGKISSAGGDVFLVANRAVGNLGTIDALNGTAELVTGSQILLTDNWGGAQVAVQAGSGGQVLNAGTIEAAQISLQAADGNVYALAGNHSVLRATGTAKRDGHVWLVATGGSIDARGATIAAHNADGSGGAVDMNADSIRVDNVQVSAAQWNLTAPVFTIDTPTANAFAANLSNGTSIAVNTTGANGASGDIGVQSSVRWNGASSLALNAYRSISIAPGTTIANTGAGNLTLRADATGIDNAGSVGNGGTIDWSRSTGIVSTMYDMNGTYAVGTIDSNTAWSTAPFSGLVTQVTAYQLVNSIADLNAINHNLSGNYALGRSINLSGPPNAFTPIGGASGTAFTGQFDGMGNVLSGLSVFNTVTDSTTANTGLFATIGAQGVVRNFDITDGFASSSLSPVGLLAGENDGTVAKVGTTGTVEMDAEDGTSLGGLVGVNRGTIERSWSGANLFSQGEMGGLVGENDGTIVQSYALGNATGGSHSEVGGLVGNNTGTIDQSYSTGTVSGEMLRGGLVGLNSGLIEQSYTASPVGPAGPTPIPPGGIAGENEGTIATDVYWNTTTSGAPASVGTGTPASPASGLTSAQMAETQSYSATWDFGPSGAWALPAGYSYPVLRWQLEP
ncbi:filamentous hemagglutinin N-terminal domain-containing protein [Paraburkholderia phosphatilytica]|uniref:two-partner secretion domain-containing protein n=1 Tax=Paraburkholderia phosphatilytica TaxID=2282883 RepID=UPI001F0B7661|nr:filamentous hemagglutinin N-terminal domain-containing protein [Paraburkholderia phosphatilytica]